MLVALLAQAIPIAPPPPSADDEVVVIGERLKRWTGKVTSNPLGTHCRTTVSTGDGEIDAVGCKAMMACWPAYKPRLEAAADRHLAAAEHDRLRDEIQQDFGVCLRARRSPLLAALVDRRHAAREAAR